MNDYGEMTTMKRQLPHAAPSHRLTLSAAISCALFLGTSMVPAGAMAATIDVTNCNDSGEGSLRAAVSRAASGDTIALNNAGCKRISLSSGPITIPQNDLTLSAAGRYTISVDGAYKSNVLNHTGTGTLTLRSLSIERGHLRRPDGDGNAYGGCIYSSGNVALVAAEVRHCTTNARRASQGGAIYSKGNITLNNSSVFDNITHGAFRTGGALYASGSVGLRNKSRVLNSTSGTAGGIYAIWNATVRDSLLKGNTATDWAGAVLVGNRLIIERSVVDGNSGNITGGVSGTNVSISDSTFSNNVASSGPSALRADTLEISNSSISGNKSTRSSANNHWEGVISADDLIMRNTTVAYNVMIDATSDGCAAAVIQGDYETTMQIDSSIVANNTCNDAPANDVAGDNRQDTTVTGANNLIMRAGPRTTLPADTIAADPRLEPLANNGGPTMTHALGAGSQAINTGNNTANLVWDQRGVGYSRAKGGRADIGAYEK